MKIKKKMEVEIDVNKDECGDECDWYIPTGWICSLFRKVMITDDRCPECLKQFGVKP